MNSYTVCRRLRGSQRTGQGVAGPRLARNGALSALSTGATDRQPARRAARVGLPALCYNSLTETGG